MKKYLDIIRQWIVEILRLMKKFKWEIGFYIFYFVILLISYSNPPALNDPIWGAEAVKNLWYYANQEVYIGNLGHEIRFFSVLFLLAACNMRHHPKLARLLFLYPVFVVILSLVTEMFFY